MDKHTSAGCYILRKNNGKYELLLIHRNKYEDKEINWIEENKDGKKIKKSIVTTELYVIPKGHREGDEDLEQTAKREVEEETGYSDIEIVKPLGLRSYILDWNPPIEKTDHYYLAILKSDERKEQSLTEWESESGMNVVWVDVDEGFKLLTWENNPEILKKIKEYISNPSIS
jgi:8-oxo-dGTP pyrophosphatase MutT (NUDIX family)